MPFLFRHKNTESEMASSVNPEKENVRKSFFRWRLMVVVLFLIVTIFGILGTTTQTKAEVIVQQQNYKNTSGTLQAAPAQQPDTAGADNSSSSCGFMNLGGCFVYIAFWIMGLMALVLWLAGTLLDFVINQTIIQMATNLTQFTGLNTAWKIIRDLMNVAFIFLLVYEGIKMIISKSSTGEAQKLVASIIMASLLINFSLFFTKVLIDASNIVTVGIYNSLIDNSINSSATATGDLAKKSGLSLPFMKALGVSDFYSQGTFSSMVNKAGSGGNLVIIGLLGSVVFLIISFVFFAISALFVVRYVTLLILLMLSPIAFMGGAISFVKTYTSDWWRALNSQLIFAPVFMIMMSIVISLMSSPGFISKSGNWGDVISANATEATAVASNTAMQGQSSLSLILNFVIIIGLIIFSLVIAKKTSFAGSQYIGQATNKLTSAAGTAVMGGTAAIGRRTVGAGASRLAESDKFQKWAGRSAIGDRALKITRGTAGSSFDVRAGITGKAIGATGMNMGKAKEGGFDKTLADKTAAQQKFGDSLRSDDAKRAYAVRKAKGSTLLRGLGVRGGSMTNGRTLGGIMGRSERVMASKILHKQIEPLETMLQTLKDTETSQNDTKTNLNQRLVDLNTELATLRAAAAAAAGGLALSSTDTNRKATLENPNGPLKNINDQMAAINNKLLNTTTQIHYLTAPVGDPTHINGGELTRRRAEVDRLVSNSKNQVPLTPQQLAKNAGANAAHASAVAAATAAGLPPPPAPKIATTRNTRADEQNF